MIDTILVCMLMFWDYQVGILSISDLGLIILLARALFYDARIYINKNEKSALGVFLIGILLSTIFNIYKPYFIFSDYITTLFKLFIYILAVCTIPEYLSRRNLELYPILKKFLSVSVLGGIIQYLIVFIFGRGSWPLYSLGGHLFGLDTERTMFNNMGMMRARSFWSEPSYYAISISLIFILLLFCNKGKIASHVHLIYIVGIITANSISGYGIMAGIYILYVIDLKSLNKTLKTLLLGGVCVIAVIYIVYSNDYLQGRLLNLLELKDNSGVVRTVGGFHILPEIPWYGVGIGNHANFYKTLTNLNSLWFTGTGEFFNNILLAIVTTGYIGALGFLLFEYQILARNKKIFIALIITHCGWGKLYTTPIWVFLIFYSILYLKDNKKIQEKENCGND